jgi:hypothetical protein
MHQELRSRVASIVAANELNKKTTYVYSYSEGKYAAIHTKIEGGVIKGYDYSVGGHFTGKNNQTLDFYDYSLGGHVQLKKDGARYSGYDYISGSHFVVNIKGDRVNIYDYQTGSYHDYLIRT